MACCNCSGICVGEATLNNKIGADLDVLISIKSIAQSKRNWAERGRQA